MKKIGLFLFFFFWVQLTTVFSFDFEQYVVQHEADNDSLFLAQFPFFKYLSVYEIDNLALLEKHRKKLIATGKNGDDFIFTLIDKYIANYNFSVDSLSQLSSLIQVGIFYLNLDMTIIDSTFVYNNIGDHIIQQSIYFIENEIDAGNLDPDAPELIFLMRKCEKSGYFITYSMSDWEKIILHIKNRNWNYLGHKFKARCYSYSSVCILLAVIIISTAAIFTLKTFKK